MSSATVRRFEIPVNNKPGLVLQVIGTNVANIPQKALYDALVSKIGAVGSLWLPSGIRLWPHILTTVDVTDGVILKEPAPALAMAASAGPRKFSIPVTNVDGLELGVRAESFQNVPARALYDALHSHGRAGTLRLASGEQLAQLSDKAADTTGGLLLDESKDTYVFQFQPHGRAGITQQMEVDAPVGVGAIYARAIVAALQKRGIDPAGLATLRPSADGAEFAMEVPTSRTFLPADLQSLAFTVIRHTVPPKKGILRRTGGRRSTSKRSRGKGKRHRSRSHGRRRRSASAQTTRVKRRK